MSNLKILFASSEVTPFAKTGGLADVSGSLPLALASLGHKVVVVMPLYRSVKEGDHDIKRQEKFLSVPFKGQKLETKIFLSKMGQDIPIYFLQR
jgi:starch synthase